MLQLMSNAAPKISIIVKAFNEEDLIEACLRSAVLEAEIVNGEVILVDSISTDRTLTIASQFPIRIIQFEVLADRGCGAAVQLGYQLAKGDFIFLLDGDMELEPGFIVRALNYLEQNPKVAGVGGRLIDQQINTLADQRRVEQYSAIQEVKHMPSLGGGGLYRRSAIEAVGYLAHRWLPACEEAELGARLIASGWHIVRLPYPSVKHTGHDETTWQMITRLWRNRRLHAYGIFLRTAIGKPWYWRAAKTAWPVFITPVIYFLVSIGALFLAAMGVGILVGLFACGLVLWTVILVLMTTRKKNLYEAFLAIVAWHFSTAAAFIGFFKKVGNPLDPISARVLK